ncbi:ATP-binding protein [Streptomyces sp. NBC_01619]|uniref:ATP-binding protein n=1 Tax=Streptomyces pratisoli TaxID=3139917 RepID=A0ACC6QUN2_9ACTN|nr:MULTISPECIES: ATP-binding protein [unclassified Streptomyces]MCX4515606.1 ATP-binding protein [Streptomyces sp. NBC_01619]
MFRSLWSGTHRLPHDTTAPATARRITHTLLARWGWEPDSIDSAVLVVSELITNAVEHANPPLSLDLQPHSPTIGSPDLRIQVTDGGPASAPGPWTRSCAADEHGRGKLLIAHLATPTEASNSVHSQEVTIPSKQG